ncbi:mRNA-capping enzyme subunit beta [Trichinella spiralis]|uniref:mRNA-capping enzyme subunit beta n=1 Tax=Trichinella spiralis TaxID=6334 RepID=A0ABR3KT10_TRISP
MLVWGRLKAFISFNSSAIYCMHEITDGGKACERDKPVPMVKSKDPTDGDACRPTIYTALRHSLLHPEQLAIGKRTNSSFSPFPIACCVTSCKTLEHCIIIHCFNLLPRFLYRIPLNKCEN